MRNWGSIVVFNREKSAVAAAFGVTAVTVAGRPGRPIRLRILAPIRRDEKGVFAEITAEVAAILKHGETHVEIIRASFRELDTISHLVTVRAEAGHSVQRSFF